MIKWIIQDVKRGLLTKKSFLLLAVIVISMVSFVFTYSPFDESQQTIISGRPGDFEVVENDKRFDNVRELSFQFSYLCTNEEYQKENDCSNYITFAKYLDEVQNQSDINEEYRLKLYILDLATDSLINYYDSLEPGSHMHKTISSKAVQLDKIREVKQEIKTTIAPNYEPFMFNEEFSGAISNFNKYAIDMYETMISYQNSYPHDVDMLLTPSFFIAGYMSQYFLLIVLVTVLIIFDSYYRDFSSGVFKTILTSPTRRYRYIVMKTVSTILTISIIIFIPLIIISIYLRVTVGFDTPNYPVYISRTTLNSMNPVLKYSRVINEEKSSLFYSTYKNLCTVGPITTFPVDVAKATVNQQIDCATLFPALNITFITLSKYISIVLAYLLLIIIFISALNTLFSLIFSSPIVNASILGLTVLISIFISNLFIGNSMLKLLPFTFISPTSLLLGTIPYTLYNGVITVVIWTIVISIINYVVTKHKDFTY